MEKNVKSTKRKSFIFRGLGFPVKLVDVPMKKMVGEWVLDINFNELQLTVLSDLLCKPGLLTGDELRFIRKLLNMSTTDFGTIFGVSGASVVEWENGEATINRTADDCIRLYAFDFLRARNGRRSEFVKIGKRDD